MRGDGPARSTAATVVAATGALLLLAAAATFLAVSWDQLGLTARVAAVGSGTAAAIVGGARLRRTLPAVGAVVFHLGALLVPVDALGLALQLEATPATTWTVVGVVTMVALPLAAWAGGARLLAFAGLAGVPVFATGLGLDGVASAPLVTAFAAVLALAGAMVARGDGKQPSGPLGVGGIATPVLSVTAVGGSLLVAVGSALAEAGRGVPFGTAAMAGWVPTTWTEPVTSGVVAIGALAVAAALRRSAQLAAAVPIVLALAAVTLLLPGDAPRLARLLPWPLLFLAVEVAAASTRRDPALGRASAGVARVTEVLAALTVPATLWTVASATRDAGDLLGFATPDRVVQPDLVLAAVTALTTVAWAVAAIRRSIASSATPTASRDAAVALASTTLAAAITWVVPSVGLGVVVLLAAVAVATTVARGGARGIVASLTVLVLGATSIAGAWSAASASFVRSDPAVAVLVALVAAVVATALVLRIERHDGAHEPFAALVLLPAALTAIWVVGATLDGVSTPFALVATGGLLAALPSLLLHRPGTGDVLRGLAAVLVVVAPDGPFVLGGAVVAAPAAATVGAAIAIEAVRSRRPHLFILAGPVAVQALAGTVMALGGSRVWTGAALLTFAVATAAIAVLRPEYRAAGGGTAVVAFVPAVVLLSVTPTAIAWGTLAIGVTIIAGGLVTRQVPVAHLGGVIATIGIWQLLSIAEVDAVDVWLAAPALQLWFLGAPARRAGRMSSWVADVPPLLLVVVPAVLERVTGGGGWHTVLAGSLALVAVVGGGFGRHGGPLVAGVTSLVAVVVIETLAAVAAVPTWAWLTLGGAVLLGAGALIERTGGQPVATVRRVVDVVAERFD